jgi:hypothetical protein
MAIIRLPFLWELLKRVSTTTAGAVSLGGGPGSGSEAARAGETLGGLTRSRSWLCCPADRNNRSTAQAAESNHDTKPQVSTVRPVPPPTLPTSLCCSPRNIHHCSCGGVLCIPSHTPCLNVHVMGCWVKIGKRGPSNYRLACHCIPTN